MQGSSTTNHPVAQRVVSNTRSGKKWGLLPIRTKAPFIRRPTMDKDQSLRDVRHIAKQRLMGCEASQYAGYVRPAVLSERVQRKRGQFATGRAFFNQRCFLDGSGFGVPHRASYPLPIGQCHARHVSELQTHGELECARPSRPEYTSGGAYRLSKTRRKTGIAVIGR